MNYYKKITLDGLWEFFYHPQKFDCKNNPLPDTAQYTGKMVTPGYWDDHYELFDEEDFFGLTARFNPDYRKPHFPMGRTLTPHAASSFLVGSGFYRKRFYLDAPFEKATLTVGPAMWGCSVFCNGICAGSATGYSTASTYHLEKFLRGGAENEIVIVVCNVHDDGGAYHRVDESHDGIPRGARPGQHRGLAAQGYQSERAGIGGGVSLKLTGKAIIDDYFLSFENDVPVWHAEMRNGHGKLLRWRMSKGETVVDSGEILCDSDEISFKSLTPPQLWSDRDPVLYEIKLQLIDDNTVSDEIHGKWAPRSVAVDGQMLLVNNKPTYFRGVTEHCYFPETTNPHFDKEKYLRDLGVLKSAGFNFIRCHTWCPPEPFYDACDELGFLVQTELPVVWSFSEAEDIIRMIRRHPSAVILCEGNEKIIDETAIERLKQLVVMLHRLAPGMLFNPQEAMRGVEYEFTPGRVVTQEPLPYDAERMEKIKEFSDCFGALGGLDGYFSYGHDLFPGTDKINEMYAVYGRPCLSHEIGILGGYLDFSLEKRYEDTFIGTDLFDAARRNMKKHGVWDKARIYYEKNCLFINSIRKQLIENLRSCRNLAGFDYLGGIDTHWHLIGYPCGIFDEFYQEKYGESIADVRRYCNESVLLCGAGKFRNRSAGAKFSESLTFSYFGGKTIPQAKCKWNFTIDGSGFSVSGTAEIHDLAPGNIIALAQAEFDLPELNAGAMGILRAELETGQESWGNHWKIWVFPAGKATAGANVTEAVKLDDRLIDFMSNGGRVLLTGGFPGETYEETFRPHTSGRSLGHSGALLNEHPVWQEFPHQGFLDWQFYPLMDNSTSLITDEEMPQFKPIFELIPSFKLIRHKALLAEYAVGKGRLMICGFNLGSNDPAAAWMHEVLLRYLAAGKFADAPAWNAEALKQRHASGRPVSHSERKVDAGGRPVD